MDAIPVWNGPFKGRLLPRQSATNHLSMLFGRYEPAVTSEISRLSQPSMIAYDVGANVGYMTLALAQSLNNDGYVFAFEPVPSNIEFLRKLCSLNNLDDRVAVLPLALGEKPGKQRLVMWGSSEMHFLESAMNGQDTNHCPSVVVDSTSLDAFVFDLKNQPPNLIKIDVEGAEALVLKGAIRTLATYAPMILTEIHGPTNAGNVWDILDALNYRWLRLSAKGRSSVTAKEHLLTYFTKDAWTHHFLMIRENKSNPGGGLT